MGLEETRVHARFAATFGLNRVLKNGTILDDVILNEVKNLLMSIGCRSFALLRMTAERVFQHPVKPLVFCLFDVCTRMKNTVSGIQEVRYERISCF